MLRAGVAEADVVDFNHIVLFFNVVCCGVSGGLPELGEDAFPPCRRLACIDCLSVLL